MINRQKLILTNHYKLKRGKSFPLISHFVILQLWNFAVKDNTRSRLELVPLKNLRENRSGLLRRYHFPVLLHTSQKIFHGRIDDAWRQRSEHLGIHNTRISGFSTAITLNIISLAAFAASYTPLQYEKKREKYVGSTRGVTAFSFKKKNRHFHNGYFH